jgi:predicted PurR-regulated permease PerM
VRSFASVLTGLVVWIFALAAGLELAAAWGAIAFALNYIPFLGPLIATVFPTLFAIAQFESSQMAVVVFIGLSIIQFTIGGYLEPLITGASLKISPFAVIFAVFFWSFMWGIPGAFLGVPMLMVFIVCCAQDPSSGWIAVLLSGGSARRRRTRVSLAGAAKTALEGKGFACAIVYLSAEGGYANPSNLMHVGTRPRRPSIIP